LNANWNELEKIYSRPLIPLLISFMAGIAAGYFLPGYAPLLFPATGLSVLVILAVIFRQGVARFSPLVLFLCLGYISIQPWAAPDFPENHVTRYMDNRKWEITGEIFQPPIAPAKNKAQFYLQVHSLASDPARPFPVCGRIRITALNPSFDPVQGDRVRLRSKIRSFRNFLNPGAYDYKTHMAFKDISGSAFVSGEDLLCLRPAPEKGTPFRQKIKTLMEEAVKGPSREVLAALILGESTGIDPALRETINRSGLSHLLAISGLHIGIVASAAFFIFRYLLSFSPFLIRHAWTKKIAALAALGPILFYGWFSGMSPSTQRAVIMVATFMMTFLFERDQDIYNTLALAALVILIVHPPSLFMVSFQLSFAAVFAIVFGMSRLPTLAGPDSSVAVKWGSHLFSFLAVSFFAFLGTLPLVMFYFNQVSLIGMVSNLAGIPLIGFLAVPLGLISTAAGFFSHEAAYAGFWLCGRLLDVSLGIVSYLASFEFSAVKTITPSFLEIACFYILIFGVFQVKKYQAARILVVITFMVMTLDVTYWVHRRYFSSDLRVTVLDVGQGFSSLVEFPKGYTLMVDGGGFSNNEQFDVGERINASYLWRNKIKTLDTLILSHPNSDHLNGLIYIAEHFNVKNLWTNGEKANTLGYKALMETAKRKGIPTPAFESIPREQIIHGASLRILFPRVTFSSPTGPAGSSNSNDNTVVVKIDYGKASFLFPGDISRKTESILVREMESGLESRVLMAPHHGSKTSSSEGFVDRVNPETVIMAAGYNNRFGFPHPTVLARYRKRGCQIFQTGLNGAIQIITDGKTLCFYPTLETLED